MKLCNVCSASRHLLNLTFLVMLGLTLSLTTPAVASKDQENSCNATKLMAHPALRNNQKFWDDFANLSDPTDLEKIRELLKRHAPEVLDGSTGSQSVTNATSRAAGPGAPSARMATGDQADRRTIARHSFASIVEVSHRAKKAMDKLSPHNRERLNEFLAVLNESGLEGLRARQGSWQYKHLARNDKEHTVRLDGSVRVLFEVRDGDVHLLDIGAHVTH